MGHQPPSQAQHAVEDANAASKDLLQIPRAFEEAEATGGAVLGAGLWETPPSPLAPPPTLL